jgi:hypothetical protein
MLQQDVSLCRHLLFQTCFYFIIIVRTILSFAFPVSLLLDSIRMLLFGEIKILDFVRRRLSMTSALIQ